MARGDYSGMSGDEAGATRTGEALEWLRGAQAEAEVLAEVERRVRRRKRRARLSGLTAAAALAAIGGLAWTQLEPGGEPVAPPKMVAQLPTATISAPERRSLSDGSVVELKPGTEFTHEFGPLERRVTLRRGEAHFSVAHDVERPFVVVAGGVAVRAVGTAFAVQFQREAVEVLVTEGRVAVEKDRAPAAAERGTPIMAPTLLDAGGRAVIRLAGEVVEPELSQVAPAEIAKRLAWRVPQLDFSRTSLPEVVALMNEHRGRGPAIVLEIGREEAEAMKLSGYLAADNSAGLVRLLEANFPVVADESGGVIRVRRK